MRRLRNCAWTIHGVPRPQPHPATGDPLGRESPRSRPHGPQQDRNPRISHARHRGRRRAHEDGSRGHLRHGCEALRPSPDDRPLHHGPREHRLHRQVRQGIHPPQGLQRRRSRLRRALCDVRQVRALPCRPVSPLRKHRLAQQSRVHPLWLHLGRARAPSVRRLRPVCLPALERGAASCAQGREP